MATQLEQQLLRNYSSEFAEKEFSTDETADENIDAGFGITTFSFPEDLGTKELNQYVLFNINVRGKSSFDKNKRIAVVKRAKDSANMSEEQMATAKRLALDATAAAGGVTVATGGTKFVTDRLKKAQEKSGKPVDALFTSTLQSITTTGKIVGGAAGAVIGEYLNAEEMLKQDTTYRISDSIALFISEPPTVKYNAMYDSKDLGSLAGFVGGVSSGGLGDGLGVEGAAALAMKAAMIPQAGGVPVADIISASSKTTLNPFKEVLFTGIDFRSFSFKYKFMPKSKKESDQVQAIIQKFKFHMHPELSENKLFFIYPSEFEISYILNGSHNTYLHKLKPCALETMDITYGGEQYSSFTNGNPTEINMSLVFRELEILTKKQMNSGY